MEAILTECVRDNLRHFVHRNAVFMCERLCAEIPSETNLQLLATCYLENNQAHCAYKILKGAHMAQCRYLFALSCFQMDLLSEAEAALSPSESSMEVPNGAAGHYLLGLIFRYTDRRQSAIHHFNQALALDPLLWTAYEELCILGAAEEATKVFDEGASLCIQKQYLHRELSSQNMRVSSVDHDIASNRSLGSADDSTRQLHTQGNSLRDISRNNHGAASSQPLNCGSAGLPFYNTPSPMTTQSQVSERLFSDSGQRQSMRLAGESVVNTNSCLSVSGNGTSHSSKFLGGSKLISVASHSLAYRKGQSWTNENADEAD